MTIGGTLANARQEAGLTIAQVSRQTRIRETVISAIERDDYTPCGGNFYARGHIRSIGRVVGVDPEPLVQEYDDTHGGSPQALTARQAFEPERPVPFRDRRSPNWTAAMVVALVLVVVYGIVRVATSGESHKTVQRAAEPVASSPAPAPSRSAQPEPVAKAPRKDVTVRVKAKRACWLSVRDAKGHQLYSGIISAGDSEEWTAKKYIRLFLGNGGGVALTVNGKNVGSPGDGYQRLKFGPEDPEKG